MFKLRDHIRELLGNNLASLRQVLGISHELIAKGAQVTEGTVIKIEQGNKGYTIDSLLNVVLFYGYTLHEIANHHMVIPKKSELISRMEIYHKANGLNGYEVIFEQEEPNIQNIVREDLIREGILDVPQRVKDLLPFCNDRRFKYTVLSGTLSNALKQMVHTGELLRIPASRNGYYLYQKNPSYKPLSFKAPKKNG